MTGADGRLLKANEYFCKMLGYDCEDLTGLNFNDITHPDDREIGSKVVDRLLSGEINTAQFEKRYLHKSGNTIWCDISTTLLKDKQGRFQHFITTAQNITDSKLAENRLKAEKYKSQTYLDITAVCIVVLDREGCVTLINKYGAELLGYETSEVIGKNWFENFIPERYREEINGVFRQVLTGDFNSLQNYENPIIKKGGEELIIFWRNTILHDEFGQFAGVLSSGQDITESKKAEKSLRDSERSYRELFDSINDLVYTQDLQGRFLSLNPSLARILGYEPEELVGVKTSQLMEPKFRKFFDTEYLGGLKREGNHQGTSKYLTKDGGARYLEYNSSLVTTAEGEQYISGIGRDVTERIKAQKQMEALQKQLRQTQKMEAVGTLAGGIAHNFNNILAAIQGYAEIALEEGARGRTNLHEIENILEASDRAKSLVRRILSFSRGDQPQFKAMEINKAVIPAINLLQQTLPKMINLQIELAEKPDLVNLDPYDIEQVIINLGTNARDAMPEGGTLTVSTSQSTVENMTCLVCPEPFSGGYAVITVADNGQGISQEELERIFDPFFTTKEVDKGTGLGLSTVFGIVRSHNGHITCETEPGKGTTFQIYLPINDAEPDVSDEEVPAEKIKGGQETILLVDDEEQILEIGAQQLSGSGYNVLTAHNGEEALEVFKAKRDEIAVVILDLSMPVMGGHKCLQELLLLSPEIKVIISTGYSLAGDIGEAMSSGAAALLSKPFSKHEMLKTVRMVLDA